MKSELDIDAPKVHLPIDVIFLIIEHLVPDSAGPRPILPAHHEATKSLLSCTTVSKTIYPFASRLIWQNCIYIESGKRTQDFHKFVTQRSLITGQTPWEAYGPTRMFLCPFSSLTCPISPAFLPQEYSPAPSNPYDAMEHHHIDGAGLESIPSSSTIEDSPRPPPDDTNPSLLDDTNLSPIDDTQHQSPTDGILYQSPTSPAHSPTSLASSPLSRTAYFSPRSPVWSHLYDLPTIQLINEILITLAPVLKIMVVDMPLRSLYPRDDDQGVRKLLRQGFEALVNVEELVSVDDYLYLDTEVDSVEPQVWTRWPKLRRMALWNIRIDERLCSEMASCPELEMAVLSKADTWPGGPHRENIKEQWSKAADFKEVTIAFVDWHHRLPDFNPYVPHWHELDPQNKLCILTVPLLPPNEEGYGEYPTGWPTPPDWLSQAWIRERALSGTLWSVVKTDSNFKTTKR
ncbi:hypothetical protein FSARC_5941 [Fusarium sarcochroum]|uniref:F-box domain-containing protein n=1 Tax=Fusarium sarcochroum TaxID=1208366 RepID=A0A8H4TYH6_9HYPO|nr:hypothetical protein FSARC_5941 [Fusarium sarcochroum]